MNIHEAAAASGLAADTIRFYERQGVLPAPPRQPNGYRAYTAQHVETLRFAKGLRQLAVPLDELSLVLAMAHDGTCGEVRERMTAVLAAALEQIEGRLRELEGTRSHVASILGGLAKMEPSDTAIPGMRPCECVLMVSAA